MIKRSFMDSVKLQKYFSDCGIMSRRAAEEEIKKGKVRVNGVTAELGLRIMPNEDTVEYNGRRILPLTSDKTYIMLNKPRGFVTTLSDEHGRHTVADLTQNVGVRVFPVGRLDMDSDGLLLLTNDGALTEKLTHPRHEIPKIYCVTVKGAPSEEALSTLRSPLTLDGYKIQPVKVEVLNQAASQNATDTILKMTLFEGRNRQIRKMCEQAGLKISRLSRVAIGNITLGSLAVGSWRHLTEAEVEYLKK